MTIAVIPPSPLRSGPFAPLDVQIWALGQTRRSCQGLLRHCNGNVSLSSRSTHQIFLNFLLFANMKVRWMCRWRMKGHTEHFNDTFSYFRLLPFFNTATLSTLKLSPHVTENCLNVKNDFIVALKVESVLIHFNMWAKGVRDPIMISWKSAARGWGGATLHHP